MEFDSDQPSLGAPGIEPIGGHELDFDAGYKAGWSAAREVALSMIAGKEAQIAGLQNEIAALRGMSQG